MGKNNETKCEKKNYFNSQKKYDMGNCTIMYDCIFCDY